MIDNKFLAKAIRVSFELSTLVAGGLEASNEAEALERKIHMLWIESGREDAPTREICLWAEAQGEVFKY